MLIVVIMGKWSDYSVMWLTSGRVFSRRRGRAFGRKNVAPILFINTPGKGVF